MRMLALLLPLTLIIGLMVADVRGEAITFGAPGYPETTVSTVGLDLNVKGKIVKLITFDNTNGTGAIVFADGIVLIASDLGAFVWKLGELHSIKARLRDDVWDIDQVKIENKINRSFTHY